MTARQRLREWLRRRGVLHYGSPSVRLQEHGRQLVDVMAEGLKAGNMVEPDLSPYAPIRSALLVPSVPRGRHVGERRRPEPFPSVEVAESTEARCEDVPGRPCPGCYPVRYAYVGARHRGTWSPDERLSPVARVMAGIEQP